MVTFVIREQRPLSPDPCQICGSKGFEGLIMACFRCREVREHTSLNGTIHTMAVEEDCTLDASERGTDSEPENSSTASRKRSDENSKLRTRPVEDFQNSGRDEKNVESLYSQWRLESSQQLPDFSRREVQNWRVFTRASGKSICQYSNTGPRRRRASL
ncbi:PREDICTED: uncharacterized protein LOC104819405 [Tarenaya hassleriana]|uniref:uncharacterized protein LOC104819405 n=1 Tax=Tarenaya hassleriana TaxID=28532 RepID=UPI00053C3F17|nr:PREDICTED: uncharacterized protein LOC104819405 [Tarenaya hassleriana]